MTPVRFNSRKRTLTGPETVIQEETSVLAQIKSRKVESIPSKEDEYDVFGKHVAFELARQKMAGRNQNVHV